MVYLFLAVLSSTLVSVIMRVSEKHIKNNITMLASNYLACILMAAAFVGNFNLWPGSDGNGFAAGFGVVSGVFYLGSFILLQWNVSKNGIVFSSMFMKLGVLVPTVLSILIFHEVPKTTQLIGIVAAVAAILIINSEKGSAKVQSGLGLVALLLAGGATDATSKFFDEWGNPLLQNHFLLYTFIAAFFMCVLLCVVKKQSVTLMDVGFGLAIGVPNYLSARFLLLSLGDVPAVIAYPTYSIATIVVVTLIGVLLFHERLSRRQLVSMGVISASLLLLNL